MGRWTDTEYGKRYAEDHKSCRAFFKNEPDQNSSRYLPAEVTEIILKAGHIRCGKIRQDD